MNHPWLWLPVLAFALLLGTGCQKRQTEEELLKSATLHHGNEEYDDAIADFQELVAEYPKSDKVPEALFAMGIIYQNKKNDFRKAESLYTKLVFDFPSDPTAQGAAYQRARLLAQKLHEPDSAKAAYQLFLSRYPDAVASSSARIELDSLDKQLAATK